MKNKNLGMFFSVIIASLVALGAPVLAEDVDTTTDVGNSAPTVNLVDTPPTVSLIESETDNTFEVTCQYTDDNGISDIDKSASYLAFGDGSYYNKTLSNAIVSYTSVDTTTENATITVENIPYYESPTTHDVNCYVEDNASASGSLTETTDIATLVASDVNVTSLGFGSLHVGDTGTTDTFKVENTGNVLLNSSWEGTDYSSDGNSFGVNNAYINSTVFSQLTLSNLAQFYGQVETQTDAGNGNRQYEPYFGLTIPGTPQGSYSNTMTHTVVEA